MSLTVIATNDHYGHVHEPRRKRGALPADARPSERRRVRGNAGSML